MPIDIFGFSLGRKQPKEQEKVEKAQQSFVAPEDYDGTYTLETGSVFGAVVDFTGTVKDENQLIAQYRAMSLYPEVDQAIEDVVNESVVYDHDRKPMKLDLSKTNLSENIKNKIYSEYDYILKLLDMPNRAQDIFRRWYVDSKLFYHIIIDNNVPQKGIQELRSIDPVKIKKMRKVEKEQNRKIINAAPMIKKIEEFYIYTDTDKDSYYPTTATGIKIHPDSIAYVHSGTVDTGTKRVVGYLQKAIRPLNMLRQIEDAVVIYRISRAPERRIFYIDVGNLPKNKAEQYLRDIMNRYRNKLTYDASTGVIKDSRDHLHMLEDYWIPRREGGKGTEVSLLDGGQNLGEMDDVEYLLKKVYRSLNVPISRMEPENGFNMGRAAEITRDEVKFFKFIEKLRHKFSSLFVELLKTQVILKGIMSEDDWKKIYHDIDFTFNKDSYFSELKNVEIMRERFDLLNQANEYIGKYFSEDWVRKNILQQSEEEIKEISDQISQEAPVEEEMPQEESPF